MSWMSIDPRSEDIVPYSPEVAQQLEAAYSSKQPNCSITVGGMSFVVHFGNMKQKNAQGGQRSVLREVPVPKKSVHEEHHFFSRSTLLAGPAMAEAQQRHLASLKDGMRTRSFVLSPFDGHRDAVHELFDAMCTFLRLDRYVTKYGGTKDDVALTYLERGRQVPNYYANVAGESIYRRKVLSLLGLRNLVDEGVPVFNDLLQRLFSGDPKAYPKNKGLSRLRNITGNTVDLDSTIFNPSRQLRAINAMLVSAGQTAYSSVDELEKSPAVYDFVVPPAKVLIDAFIDELRLTPAEQATRHLQIAPYLDRKTPIPQSTSNVDRGVHPVWQYRQAGVSTYHVNVPHIEDVVGGLLRAPYSLAAAFATLLLNAASSASSESTVAIPETALTEALDELWEEGVSDTCLNGKWKAIEMYWEHVSTANDIPKVLANVQQRHQQAFLLLDDDDSRQKELALMWRLVKEAALAGVDSQTRQMRLITRRDIENWIRATS